MGWWLRARPSFSSHLFPVFIFFLFLFFVIWTIGCLIGNEPSLWIFPESKWNAIELRRILWSGARNYSVKRRQLRLNVAERSHSELIKPSELRPYLLIETGSTNVFGTTNLVDWNGAQLRRLSLIIDRDRLAQWKKITNRCRRNAFLDASIREIIKAGGDKWSGCV